MGDWVKSLRNPRNGADRTIQDGFNPVLGTSLCRDSPDSTLECRIQCPPLQGQAIRSRHPKQHKGMPFPTPNNADSGHRRLTGLDLRNPLENTMRSSKSSPPSSRAGSLLWLLRRAAGNPLAASAALRNQTVSAFNLRVRDPAAAPDWLLGASPLLCRGRNRGARLLNAQWWARSCDRSDVGRLARPMGRGDGRAAGAHEWTPTNAITRWRMRPVHMAIALTRQVIQRQCQSIDPDCPISGHGRLSL